MLGRLWLKAFGWRLETQTPPHSKFVIIGAPHTSNWDLPFTLATAYALRIPIYWMGKHTLFRGPKGWLFRMLGGIPVDRRAAGNTVAQTAEAFKGAERMTIAVAPEGTRQRAKYWKSGFYYIAKEAGVPIGCGYLDYARKASGVGLFLHPTGDIRKDMETIRAFYRDIKGKYPQNQIEPRLREEAEPEIEAAGIPALGQPLANGVG